MTLTSIVSIVSILLLVLTLLVFVVLLPVAIIFSTRAGVKYRKELARQLDQLRLGRMLTALGIDIDSYLSGERAVEIRKQIARCGACTNTAECDTHLDEGSVNPGNIDYCRNEKTLQKIAGRHTD